MHLSHKIPCGMANSAFHELSDLGLHCLHMPLFVYAIFSEKLVYESLGQLAYRLKTMSGSRKRYLKMLTVIKY